MKLKENTEAKEKYRSETKRKEKYGKRKEARSFHEIFTTNAKQKRNESCFTLKK
jgi:hypothetical protein